MPRGRQPNYDARIGNLLDQLRDAIVAREKAAMDARVSQQVRALVSSLDSGPNELTYRRLQRAAAGNGTAKAAPTPAKKRGRRGWTPAQRAEQRAKMKAYWAKRKSEKSKAGK